MMKGLMIVAGAVLLAACGPTLEARHVGCMDMYADFANQLACVKNSMGGYDNALTREYLMTGDALLADVRAGRMSEEQARLQFLRKLNDLEAESLRRAAYEAEIRRDVFPRQTTCVPVGNRTQCTTF